MKLATLLAAAALASGVALTAQTMPSPTMPMQAASGQASPAPDQVTLDARRHGPEIVAFAGVRPGYKIVDLAPGTGYWTRLFAAAAGPTGHVYGIAPTPLVEHHRDQFTTYAAMPHAPGTAPVTASEQPATSLSVPERVDLVFTSQNYHDYLDPFMGPVDPTVFNKLVYAALKPGGTFVVIDHVAAPGSGARDTDTLHRIDPAIVRQQVTAAGFRFVGESRVLANPADDHSKRVFDPAIRGHTDQFVFKFRKPG